MNEASRHECTPKLEEVLGAEVAATMMERLPPVGWADVATKHDLEVQRALIELQVRADLRGEINRLLLWLFPTTVTLLGLTFAAAKLS